MPKKIQKLTEAQIAAIPRYVAEWTAHGLCTQPADRPAAEKAIRMMYAGAGLPAPRIIWADSPLSGALVVQALEKGDSVWASVGDSVWDNVWDNVRASVRASVRDSVWASVRASVWDSVGDNVRASVRASVWASVGGQHEAHWLAFYHYFRDECGLVEETKTLDGLWLLAQSCGWVYPYEDVCVATERPTRCLTDENGRIHSETGPAILYPDGFAIYAWHGTRLPAEWVDQRATIDPALILKAENVEQRAAGAAMIGWARMSAALDRRIIDGDPDSDIGALVELTLPGLSQPGRFLMAVCPRNGTICEGVPRVSDIDNMPIETAIAAQAWRDCLSQAEYTHPALRT